MNDWFVIEEHGLYYDSMDIHEVLRPDYELESSMFCPVAPVDFTVFSYLLYLSSDFSVKGFLAGSLQ